MGRRLALLIATHEHEDPTLRRLTSPAADVESLAAVLRDPRTTFEAGAVTGDVAVTDDRAYVSLRSSDSLAAVDISGG